MKLSVIVPIYNMQNFIRQSILCLKSQDIQDVEFLLINDGSTDDTLRKMEALCSGDKCFKIFTKKIKVMVILVILVFLMPLEITLVSLNRMTA